MCSICAPQALSHTENALAGRELLHEHPQGATSWLEEPSGQPDNQTSDHGQPSQILHTFDMSAYGLRFEPIRHSSSRQKLNRRSSCCGSKLSVTLIVSVRSICLVKQPCFRTSVGYNSNSERGGNVCERACVRRLKCTSRGMN